MKKTTLIIMQMICLLFSCHSLRAQVSKIKNYIGQIYFNVPSSHERFDIKAIFDRSENFYDYNENKMPGLDYIETKFEENPKLNFLGSKNSLTVFFKGDGTFSQLVINSYYLSKEINRCEDQINELLSIFKNSSFKLRNNFSYGFNKTLIGRGYDFYSSEKTYKNYKSFLSISCKQRGDEGYILDVHYFPSNLK